MGRAKIFATTNPDSPAHWLKQSFLNGNPDVYDIHFTMLDNPQLTQSEREYLERQHKGLWYRRFISGEWCLAEGAVFDFFDEKQHTLRRASAYAKYSIVGVDYGTVNPTAFTMINYNDQAAPTLFAEKEYYWDSKKTERQKTDSEYAQDLIKFIEGYNVKFVFIDPSAASFKQELRRQGFNVPIRDAENDVLNGVRELSSLLANGDLKISSSCRNLIAEMQGYSWDPYKSEKGEDVPLKRLDHAVDSLRYGVFSYFGHKLSLREPSQDQMEGRTLGSLREQTGDQYPGSKIIHSGRYMPDVREASQQFFNQKGQTSRF
jgi:PBSX family phage terminase large subunit